MQIVEKLRKDSISTALGFLIQAVVSGVISDEHKYLEDECAKAAKCGDRRAWDVVGSWSSIV